jgi:hypothetical protein
MREGRFFFFVKKKQKTFVSAVADFSCCGPHVRRVMRGGIVPV